MAAQVRLRKDDLLVVGHGRVTFYGATMGEVFEHISLATLEGAGPASFSSLRRALIDWREGRDDPTEVRVWVGIKQIAEKNSASSISSWASATFRQALRRCF